MRSSCIHTIFWPTDDNNFAQAVFLYNYNIMAEGLCGGVANKIIDCNTLRLCY